MYLFPHNFPPPNIAQGLFPIEKTQTCNYVHLILYCDISYLEMRFLRQNHTPLFLTFNFSLLSGNLTTT